MYCFLTLSDTSCRICKELRAEGIINMQIGHAELFSPSEERHCHFSNTEVTRGSTDPNHPRRRDLGTKAEALGTTRGHS